MKFQIAFATLLVAALSGAVYAQEKSCSSELGKKQAQLLVKWCILKK